MAKRVSHSFLDPFIVPIVKPLYRALHIPRRFPPEGIVVTGHLIAVAGAFGFAYSATHWWGGLLAAGGVIGNHIADMVDGTHARTTDQCRNGGELLDHFTDPLSFSYWMIGLGLACASWPLAVTAIIGIYATAVLTNIKAKMLGEFTLAAFGPTEFKSLLAILGLASSLLVWKPNFGLAPDLLILWFLRILIVIGLSHLFWSLVRTVREVNAHGSAPDTTDWEVSRQADSIESGDSSRGT